jgi:hypothetical protein
MGAVQIRVRLSREGVLTMEFHVTSAPVLQALEKMDGLATAASGLRDELETHFLDFLLDVTSQVHETPEKRFLSTNVLVAPAVAVSRPRRSRSPAPHWHRRRTPWSRGVRPRELLRGGRVTPDPEPADENHQVPLGENDAKQAALAKQAKRGKGRLPKPERALDLRRNHPLSMGRNNASLHWDEAGRLRQACNISEDTAKELVRLNRRSGDAAPPVALVREPKPGEPEQVMPLKALQDALVVVGPTEALVHELVALATQRVITHEHVMYDVYQRRFNNSIKRCAAALREQGIQVWSRRVRIDGVNLKRFGAGGSVPDGGELVE